MMHWVVLPERCTACDSIGARGIVLCYVSNDFAFGCLSLLAAGATLCPHRMKVCILCRIKNVELERRIEKDG